MDALTPQEREILRLRAHGMTSQAVAARLRVAPRTVRRRMRSAEAKLGVGNSIAAVLAAYRDGWIDLRKEGRRPLRDLLEFEREALCAVVSCGGVVPAAARLGLARKTVSNRLTDVRRALGAPEALPLEALAARAVVFGIVSLKEIL